MSESKLTFYEDGPTKYTYEEFCEFRKILSEHGDEEKGGFDAMCFIWINGHYPKHIRNLCLRNILRQIGEKRLSDNYPTIYNNCDISFGRLLYLLNKDSFLQKTLQFQPEVCQDFCAELLYDLEHGFRNALPYAFARNDLDQLITLLVKITDQATGHRLWHYHTFEIDLLDNLRETLSFCELSFVPHWLREHLISEIKGVCKTEFQDNLEFFISKNSINLAYTEQKLDPTNSAGSTKATAPSKSNHLWPVLNHIEFQARSAREEQNSHKFDLSLQFIEMFEKDLSIPQSITYIDQRHILDVATLIQTPDILHSFISRHLLALDPEEYVSFQYHQKLIILRYLRDFISHFAPNNHSLITKLDEIIDYRPDKLET